MEGGRLSGRPPHYGLRFGLLLAYLESIATVCKSWKI